MSVKHDVKRYGTLIVGIFIAAGFSLGAMASYSSMVNTQSSNNNQGTFNATVPSNTFSAQSYGLSLNEQRVLAARNDIVFVTLLYDSEESYEVLQELDGMQEPFGGRMLIQLVNESSTSQFARYGFTDYPKGVVVGGNRGNSALQLVQTPTEDSIKAASCSAFASWNPGNGPSVASICSQ